MTRHLLSLEQLGSKVFQVKVYRTIVEPLKVGNKLGLKGSFQRHGF